MEPIILLYKSFFFTIVFQYPVFTENTFGKTDRKGLVSNFPRVKVVFYIVFKLSTKKLTTPTFLFKSLPNQKSSPKNILSSRRKLSREGSLFSEKNSNNSIHLYMKVSIYLQEHLRLISKALAVFLNPFVTSHFGVIVEVFPAFIKKIHVLSASILLLLTAICFSLTIYNFTK